MLVGYDANNIFRHGGELGDWSRMLIEKLATGHISVFRAMLFATRMKDTYKKYYSSFSNVSTFVPEGTMKLMPSTWMRYGMEGWLRFEKVKIFHGLNEEIPYGIGGEVKTVVTVFSLDDHHKTSMMDSMFWKKRMAFAYKTADVVVAVSEEVKRALLELGVNEDRVVVIGEANPYEVTDEVAQKYFELYKRLLA